MFTLKSLLRLLLVWPGIVSLMSLNIVWAAEKPVPVDSKQQPEIFVQLGHSGDVSAMAVSPDGQHVVSGSSDSTIKLWNIPLKKEVRTIKLAAGVNSVQFSRDGKLVLTGDSNGDLIIWDFTNWKILHKFKHSSKNVTNFQLSANGKYALSSNDKLIYWDIRSGRKIFEYQDKAEAGKSNQQVNSILSNGGKQIAIGYSIFREKGDAGRIDIFDVATKKILRKFPVINGSLTGIKWSPNDRHIAGIYRVGAEGGLLNVQDAQTGKIIKTITYEKAPWSVDFSADGKYCAVGTYGKVFLYDAETWQQIMVFAGGGPVLFSCDSNILFYMNYRDHASGGSREAIHLKNLTTGEIDYIAPFMNVEFSTFAEYADNNKILALGDRILSWDIPSGMPSSSLKLNIAAVSKDKNYGIESYSISGTWKGIRLWDIKNNKLIYYWPMKEEEYLNNYTFSPDGKYFIASHSDPNEIYVFNRQDFSLRKFQHKCEGSIHNLSFLPDGRRVMSVESVYNKDEYAARQTIWDFAAGNILKEFTYSSLTGATDIAEDGRYVLLGRNFPKTESPWIEHGFVLQDIVTGKILKTFKGHGDQVSSLAIYARNIIASADAQGEIKIWDYASGKLIKTLKGNTIWIKSLKFSPDGRKLLYTSADKTIRLWDIATAKELARFISFTDGEWITMTPEGYFNASPNGAKYINVRVGNAVYSIDNFYEKFFNPVYVASVLQGKKVEAVADIRKGILPPPDVKITSPAPGSVFNSDTLTITVAALDTGGGIDEVRLYHNGKVVGDKTRAVKIVSKDKEAIRQYTVFLVDGINNFRATGFSKDRTESNPAELIVSLTAPAKDVSLYVIAVGINKYKNPALDLNYAEPDARGIADFFQQQGKGLFKNVDIREIYDDQATKENILSQLSRLQNIHAQDAVLIYLAGHGENINDKWYFIPHELTYPEREEDVTAKGLSSDELSGYIKNIKAQKILLLVDACKSGAVLIAFRGFEDRKALSQLSRSTGVHIVAASTKDQFAAEVKDLGHGVFTYTLLEGLKGKAAGPHEAVTVRKLMGYIEEQLPEITKKYKREAQYPVVDSRGMDFPLVIAR
ncbi:MAG: caspase family protein [Smithellaceae bacterium]